MKINNLKIIVDDKIFLKMNQKVNFEITKHLLFIGVHSWATYKVRSIFKDYQYV